jgi:hypothetical protein
MSACFSMAWLQQLFINLVIIGAVYAIIKLLLPLVLANFGGGAAIGQIINIVLWAIILIFVIYIAFALISCLLSMGSRLSLIARRPMHRHHRRHHHHHHKSDAPFIRHLQLNIHYSRSHTVSTASLTWTAPTTRTDGSALTPAEIASTDIFDSASSTPALPIGTVQGAANAFTTTVLSVGPHSFTVIVRDTTGHSSASSNVASVTVPATLASPTAVSDLAATLSP